MSISNLFSEFKFKPGDLVVLKIDEASFNQVEELRQMYSKISADSFNNLDMGLIPGPGAIIGAPLPVIFQTKKRFIVENMGGTITTGYEIDGNDGSKLICYEDELAAFKALPTVSAPPAPTVDADTTVST